MSRRNYVSPEWLHDYTLGTLVHINAADARKGFSLGAMTPLFYFRFLARGILKLTAQPRPEEGYSQARRRAFILALSK